LAGAEVLALEFNHDVVLQRASGRSRRAIARNLGNKGHLSNEQAAALVGAILRLPEADGLRHIVQLHLSQDCNRPALALGALQPVLAAAGFPIEVHTAAQDQPGPFLTLGASAAAPQKKARPRRRSEPRPEAKFFQPYLPGWEE
jgi:hypothetical protein